MHRARVLRHGLLGQPETQTLRHDTSQHQLSQADQELLLKHPRRQPNANWRAQQDWHLKGVPDACVKPAEIAAWAEVMRPFRPARLLSWEEQRMHRMRNALAPAALACTAQQALNSNKVSAVIKLCSELGRAAYAQDAKCLGACCPGLHSTAGFEFEQSQCCDQTLLRVGRVQQVHSAGGLTSKKGNCIHKSTSAQVAREQLT